MDRRKFIQKTLVGSTGLATGGLFYPHYSSAFTGTRMRKSKNLFKPSLINVLSSLGLTANLKLCLDAGDINSYSSGQQWLDVSGNNQHFYRGVDGTVEAFDPTFNGTPGGLSNEYWQFSSDIFRISGANPTWVNNLHKNNALFTLATWTSPVLGLSKGLFGTQGAAANGIQWHFYDAGHVFRVTSEGSEVYNESDGSITNGIEDQWDLYAISVDEGGNSHIKYRSGASSSFACTYSATGTTDASQHAEIGSKGATVNRSSSKFGMFMAWEGQALTVPQLDTIYQATRSRYGV